MSYPPVAKRFFCFVGDKVEGPFDQVELSGLLHQGHLTPETQVCPEGSEAWKPFGEMMEYTIAREMPRDSISRQLSERADAAQSSWSPKKLGSFAVVMAPVLLIVLWRIFRGYLAYSLHR